MRGLTRASRELLAEPVYDAYRLGKYGESEYLDMWHELDVKPVSTPEMLRVYEVVASIVADILRDVADDPDLRLSGHSGISIRLLRDRADSVETGAG